MIFTNKLITAVHCRTVDDLGIDPIVFIFDRRYSVEECLKFAAQQMMQVFPDLTDEDFTSSVTQNYLIE